MANNRSQIALLLLLFKHNIGCNNGTKLEKYSNFLEDIIFRIISSSLCR
jgi:hypothetical protein